MGTFVYDRVSTLFEIDDRTLAHLRLVVTTKLRRSEPFMLELSMHDGSGHRSFWIHPSVRLQFRFYATHPIPINRLWIEELMVAANGPADSHSPPNRKAPPRNPPVALALNSASSVDRGHTPSPDTSDRAIPDGPALWPRTTEFRRLTVRAPRQKIARPARPASARSDFRAVGRAHPAAMIVSRHAGGRDAMSHLRVRTARTAPSAHIVYV